MLLNIDSTIEAYGLEFTQGRHVDSFFICLLFNALDVPRRFTNAFEMITHNPSLWLTLAKDAARLHDVSSEKTLVAEFSPDAEFPFYRLYGYRYGHPHAVPSEALRSVLARAMVIATARQLAIRYNDRIDMQRSEAWVNELKKALAPSTLIAEGRVQNTTVAKVYVLYRKAAGCVLCGAEATGYVGSTVAGPSSILYIANTCQAHQEVAKKFPSVLHFIFELFELGLDLGSILKTDTIPTQVMSLIQATLSHELDASPIGSITKGDQTTLTFQRRSGFRIILRLKTLMNYAYMIDAPDGTPYRRIDAAPDHPDIPFFPDHIHLAPRRDNSDVVSSFTYGFPLLDLPLIKRLLHEGEQAFTI
ncbi:hypothetical protein [Burkholderia pseudomallei]|uniref:hypothetical protein n=1 Tax=Burkholderia pseudomallei TaxID=28450 RepID=UPI003F65BE94